MLLDSYIAPFLLLPSAVQLGLVFVFSLLVGSFLNRVIYRLPIMLENEWSNQAREIFELSPKESCSTSLIKPKSRCRDCGRGILAIENIPVISYIFMRGKCRGCSTKISIFYPIVEILTASLAVLVFWKLGSNAQGFFALFFVFALVALTGIDFKTQLLPDVITIPLMWAGIILSFWSVFVPLETAVIGALVGYLSLWFVATLFKALFKKEGVGLGDAKLLAAIFAWVNIQYFPLVILIASVVGLIITIIHRLISQDKMTDKPLPFGAYLALGGILAMLYGKEMVDWYIKILLG